MDAQNVTPVQMVQVAVPFPVGSSEVSHPQSNNAEAKHACEVCGKNSFKNPKSLQVKCFKMVQIFLIHVSIY